MALHYVIIKQTIKTIFTNFNILIVSLKIQIGNDINNPIQTGACDSMKMHFLLQFKLYYLILFIKVKPIDKTCICCGTVIIYLLQH